MVCIPYISAVIYAPECQIRDVFKVYGYSMRGTLFPLRVVAALRPWQTTMVMLGWSQLT